MRRSFALQGQQKGTVMVSATSLESKETTTLIGSDKVEGTAVYGADQKKIGSIQRVMIDKLRLSIVHPLSGLVYNRGMPVPID